MQQSILHTLRWVRRFGDVVFIVGAFAIFWQVVIGVFQPKSYTKEGGYGVPAAAE